MTWNQKLSVGVQVMDDDHKRLVGMLNQLFDAMQAGQGKEVLGCILDDLVDYTKRHFAREEAFFAKTGYPDAEAHHKEHADLTAQVLEVQQKYNSGNDCMLSLELMRFLKNWLTNHIQGADQKYGPYLNSKGIH
jgi:hemerythrin